MGGCRCNFRGCDNSTHSRPGMHFFHFPCKDTERCDKWITYSHNPSFKGMEHSKLRNRNVCEEHFRVEMFMNIRKERLVRYAYPTLLKTKCNGKVYDLEKMMYSPGLNDAFTVDSFLDDEFDEYLVNPAEDPTKLVVAEKTVILNENNILDIPIEFGNDKLPVTDEKVNVSKKIILTPVKTLKRVAAPVLTPVPIKKTKTMKILNSSNLMKSIQSDPIEIHSTTINTDSPLRPPKIEQEPKETEKIQKLMAERDKAITNEQRAKKDLRESQATISELQLKIKVLEDKLKLASNEKLRKPKSLVKSIQTDPEPKNATKVSASPNALPPTKPGTLSKPQLFNGIKRYLSNAMATLLKMEMFGNSEREWKADEKQIACEIMQLGKDTYEFMTDEWRLRLPPKSDVNNWLEENADDDDDDLF